MTESFTEQNSSPSLARIVEIALAQSIIAGAMLYYYGYQYASAWYSYMGIPDDMVTISPADLMLLGGVSAVGPVLVLLAFIVVVAILFHHLVRRLAANGRVQSRHASWLIGIVGFGTFLFGTGAYDSVRIAAGLFLIASSVDLVARNPKKREGSARVTYKLIALIVIGLSVPFLLQSTTKFVEDRARLALASNAKVWPKIEIFSEKGLQLAESGVSERELPGTNTQYAFVYSGLRLADYSDGKYFLVHDKWTPGDVVFILPEDGNRVSFP